MNSLKYIFIIISGVLACHITSAQLNPLEVPDFALTDVKSDKTISLSNYGSSKAIVVIFMSNTCPYSKLYEDRILELHEIYQPKGINFILINSNNSSLTDVDNVLRMKIKANSKNYPFPYLADKENIAKKIFQAEKTPEAFILSKDKGYLSTFYHGAIDDNPQSAELATSNYIKLALDDILEQKTSTIQYKRPVGCRIKTE